MALILQEIESAKMVSRFENYSEKTSKLLDDKDIKNTKKLQREVKCLTSGEKHPKSQGRKLATVSSNAFFVLELWEYLNE